MLALTVICAIVLCTGTVNIAIEILIDAIEDEENENRDEF